MSTSLRQRAQALGQKTWFRRVVVTIVSAFVLLGVVGFGVLPGVIKSQAEKLVAEKLHRHLTLGKVDVNPYTLSLTLHDLKLSETEGEKTFVSFESLRVNVAAQSLFRLAPVVQEVRLNKPYLHLARLDDHRYNIDDLLVLMAAQPPSPEPARFAVHNIQIEGGEIEFEDAPKQSVHHVKDLRIGIPFVSSLPSQVEVFVEPLVSATVNGTPFQLKGRAKPFAEPKEAILDVALEGVDLPGYLAYLPYKPNFRLPTARFESHLQVSFIQAKDQAPSITLGGDLALKEVQLNDAANKSLLRLKALEITLGKAEILSPRIAVEKILVDGLDADVVRSSDGQVNLARALIPPPSPSLPVAPKSSQATAENSSPAADSPSKHNPPTVFALGELELRDLALRWRDSQSARPITASIAQLGLRVRDVEVDPAKRSAQVGEVVSTSAAWLLRQEKVIAGNTPQNTDSQPSDKGGREKVLPVDSKVPKASGQESSPWQIGLKHLSIDGWTGRLEDKNLPDAGKPSGKTGGTNGTSGANVTTVGPLAISLDDFSTAPAATPAKLSIKAGVNKDGQLSISGDVAPSPLHANLQLDLKAVDLLPLQPYVTDQVNVLITRAALSTKGQLQLDQGEGGALKGGFKGDVTLGNLATVDKVSVNDFLRWKSLYFGGVNVQLAPLSVVVDQVALSDFFARIIVDSTGRINLQDIARNQGNEQKSLTEAPAAHDAKAPTATATASEAKPNASSTANPSVAGPVVPVRIRKVTLQGGQVRFTDNFIKPNYSATLDKLGGSVTGLSSEANTRAKLDLRGEVNSAPLSVAGTLNPLRGDLFLDIAASVRGMELAPLSPYAAKYAGYGIEKGKLSFEVTYQLENRKLAAQNRLILDQLTFSDNPEKNATSKLPVHLAVMLLRDRNGVIDINLPIGGSLDDPQFSVGGVIVKVIMNMVTKAITAPFALIGSLFGGGEELSYLEFDAGRYATLPAAESKLKTLAKALTDKPALKLEITGRFDAEADREGLKSALIDRKVKALKIKDLVAKGESVDPSTLTIKPEEYPALLARVYKDEKFPKPRNLVGLQKDLPVPEMEKLMIANAQIAEGDLLELGQQRAQAAKDWLVKNGQISPDRVFILATKAAGSSDKEKPSRVDFSLKR